MFLLQLVVFILFSVLSFTILIPGPLPLIFISLSQWKIGTIPFSIKLYALINPCSFMSLNMNSIFKSFISRYNPGMLEYFMPVICTGFCWIFKLHYQV